MTADLPLSLTPAALKDLALGLRGSEAHKKTDASLNTDSVLSLPIFMLA